MPLSGVMPVSADDASSFSPRSSASQSRHHCRTTTYLRYLPDILYIERFPAQAEAVDARVRKCFKFDARTRMADAAYLRGEQRPPRALPETQARAPQ